MAMEPTKSSKTQPLPFELIDDLFATAEASGEISAFEFLAQGDEQEHPAVTEYAFYDEEEDRLDRPMSVADPIDSPTEHEPAGGSSVYFNFLDDEPMEDAVIPDILPGTTWDKDLDESDPSDTIEASAEVILRMIESEQQQEAPPAWYSL